MTESLADANNIRAVATFAPACHQYAVELFERAVSAGLVQPNELVLAGHAYAQLARVQTVQVPPPTPPMESVAADNDERLL